ncbi:MAG: DUF1905 domain-containing protein [Polyangiaceae bacterium]|nr:DUF1905 domain-containing protein [Polyangiaceae bacterium]
MAPRKVELVDPGPLEFEASLKPANATAACFVDFPWDLKETYGKGNLVPVKVTWDKKVEYKGTLAKMGGECAMVLARKDVLAQLKKKAGDKVHVRVELDAAPREHELPEDAANAVKANVAAAAGWAALSPSCKREYVMWITEAKRPETRAKRVAQAVGMIAAKKKLKG